MRPPYLAWPIEVTATVSGRALLIITSWKATSFLAPNCDLRPEDVGAIISGPGLPAGTRVLQINGEEDAVDWGVLSQASTLRP